MDPNCWKTVNEIFHAALDLAPDDRAGFVAKAAGGDRDLQAEVELLLQADAQVGNYIESPWTAAGLLRSLAPSVSPGDILCGRFRIIREVAEGGMGHVYEAFDSELRVNVAVKTIRPEIASDPEALGRFRQEVQLARRITHSNVCRTYDLGRETASGPVRDLRFITMEFLNGETLTAKIERTGALPLAEALEIARQVAEGLEAARAIGIVHRDIKPANIMLVPLPGADEGFRAVITDFGLARNDPSTGPANTLTQSQTARPIGTLAYMAPEQLEGAEVSTATDIYAFGLVLFEMVTGKRAFPSGNFLSGIAKRLSGAIPDPRLAVSSLPEPWVRAIEGCLRTRPEERFQSAADAIAVLRGEKEPRGARRRFAVAFTVAAALALAAGGIYYRSHRSRHVIDKNTVVLADFDNTTGESVFDDALKTALTLSLNQSPSWNVLPENRLLETIKLMRRENTRLKPELAREVCQRTASSVYITGSIDRLGSKYVLELKALNCQSDELLAQEQFTPDRKERVLSALGSAASTLRRKLGESLTSIRQYDVSLADATTSSLDALQDLSLGRKAYRKDTGLALQWFKKARDQDASFAMAYHDLGRSYFSLDQTELGRVNFAKAYELRSHTSKPEELEITATYFENVTGELQNARYARRQQVESYPLVPEAYDGLGYDCSLLGDYDTAVEMFRKSIHLDPANPDTYGHLANSLLARQQLVESREAIQDALSEKVDGLLLHTALYDLAFLKRDAAAMTTEERWMQNQPQYESFGYSVASDSKAYAGHLREARQLTELAAGLSVDAEFKETGAMWYENAALREAAFGDLREAKQDAQTGLKMAPATLSLEVEAALAYAIAGDNSRAETLAAALTEHFSSDTQLLTLWIPAIRAQVDLNRNEPASAIKELESSGPIELGQYPFDTYGSCLYTIYLRGEAYLAAGQGKSSVDEFQKILDHGGIVGNCWTGALAHLGVARASALEASNSQNGDTAAALTRAQAACQDFLALWKDADASLPVFRQAKSECARVASKTPR
jgi:eukaryotic-like serine/threonine-protein kinase